MKLKVLIGILVFLIIVNLATIGTFLYVHFSHESAESVDRYGRRPGMRRAPGTPHDIGEPMRLRKGERKGLRTLLLQFREETQDLRDRVQALERETFDLMHKDPVPKGQIDSLLKEISLVEYEISKAAAAKLIEAKKILPPDQQKHFFNAVRRSHMRMGVESRIPRAGRGKRQWRKPHPPDSTGQ